MEGRRQPFSLPLSPAAVDGQTAQFAQALTDAIKVGGDDLGELTARARLGYAYGVTGRAGAAVDVLQQNAAVAESKRGSSDPDVFVARTDVAWAMGKAGRVLEAIALHERCFADLSRLLGSGSKHAAMAEIDLGKILTTASRHSMALRHLEHASSSIEDFGRDHPDALACRAALAAIYGVTGRRADAVAMLVAARADFDRAVGPDHFETIRASFLLASNLSASGSPELAVTEFERTLKVAGRVLGGHHPLTITGQYGLAVAYLASGQSGKAITTIEQKLGHGPQSVTGGVPYAARRDATGECPGQGGEGQRRYRRPGKGGRGHREQHRDSRPKRGPRATSAGQPLSEGRPGR